MVQFYWDSYFVIHSLLRDGEFDLAKGIVENCLFLVERHGMVIANRKRWSAGSQLPFLSQMVKAIYRVTGDKLWLARAAATVELEYAGYWLNDDHLAYRGLSRYHAPPCYPADCVPAITMDHEASWDLSPRFEEADVLELLPVDLNSNLFAYECDLQFFCSELSNPDGAEYWSKRALARSAAMKDLMWDEQDGLYYDFNFVRGVPKRLKSLASFFPLFHKLADHKIGQRVCESLPAFEKPFGLVTCDQDYGYTDRQWNYPIGWAPLHLIVYFALKNYGASDESQRIALKWLNLNLEVWNGSGKLFEKYDVVSGTSNVLNDRYKNQEGFAWTNGVFQDLVADLSESAKEMSPAEVISYA